MLYLSLFLICYFAELIKKKIEIPTKCVSFSYTNVFVYKKTLEVVFIIKKILLFTFQKRV